MKILISMTLFIAISLTLHAQESAASATAAIDTNTSTHNLVGGFAGPVFKYVSHNGESGAMLGGHAAIVLKDRYGFGVGSYGLTSDLKETDENGNEYNLYTGSLGLELHYLPNANRLMHWMGTLYIARAEVQINPKDVNSGLKSKSDPYFLLSPSVHFELNVTPVLMVNAGIGYHMAIGVDDGLSVSGKDMSGLTISASLAIGWF